MRLRPASGRARAPAARPGRGRALVSPGARALRSGGGRRALRALRPVDRPGRGRAPGRRRPTTARRCSTPPSSPRSSATRTGSAARCSPTAADTPAKSAGSTPERVQALEAAAEALGRRSIRGARGYSRCWPASCTTPATRRAAAHWPLRRSRSPERAAIRQRSLTPCTTRSTPSRSRHAAGAPTAGRRAGRARTRAG